jgi:hypothetical protein
LSSCRAALDGVVGFKYRSEQKEQVRELISSPLFRFSGHIRGCFIVMYYCNDRSDNYPSLLDKVVDFRSRSEKKEQIKELVLLTFIQIFKEHSRLPYSNVPLQ